MVRLSTQMNAYFLLRNNKRFSWKNCYSPTLKFNLGREISRWQTHKRIILLIIGRIARLQLEIYPETGWGVMTCYSYYKEILNSNMLNAYAVKISLFSRNVAWCFIGQTQLSKENFPFSLDETLSMATLNNALKNSLI